MSIEVVRVGQAIVALLGLIRCVEWMRAMRLNGRSVEISVPRLIMLVNWISDQNPEHQCHQARGVPQHVEWFRRSGMPAGKLMHGDY